MNDENIYEDEGVIETTVVTLDSMTRGIRPNLNHLGSNNPFSLDKLMKPGSRAH